MSWWLGAHCRLAVGPGDEHDGRRLREVVEGLRVKHGVGRSRNRPGEPHADSVYYSKHIRAYLRSRGIKANIPVNPRSRRKPKRGRPYKLNLEAYRRIRCSVERIFVWLKCGFGRLATRYERLITTFTAFVQLACIIIHLRFLK